MSASLTEALTCGAPRSLRVMNALPVLLDVLEVDELVLDELVGPPPINCPTTPLRLATVPFTGATSVAADRLFRAVSSAAAAPATWAFPASRSACVGGASVCAAVAR